MGIVLVLTIAGTFAWLNYRSKSTAMVLTIGDQFIKTTNIIAAEQIIYVGKHQVFPAILPQTEISCCRNSAVRYMKNSYTAVLTGVIIAQFSRTVS